MVNEWNWLALALVSGLGYKTLQTLLDHFETVERILSVDPQYLVDNFGIKNKLAHRIVHATEARSYQIETRLLQEAGNIRLYCPKSKGYPQRLTHISSPPLILYWKGSITELEGPCIAFVGSRSCTAYGKQHTRRLIKELAVEIPDLTIVSGLARGIDTIAHETALEEGLKTVAVLAGGLQNIYPPENKPLAEQIKLNGALISEFPIAVKPLARNFPIRNRIISGLSSGVVITEARKKSGALITAAFALQQNREVFALPGRVDSAASLGVNTLISRNHAKLIISANDIISELHLSDGLVQAELPFESERKRVIDISTLDESQAKILKAISEGMEDIDVIHLHTGIAVHVISGILVELEIMGFVRTDMGQKYHLEDAIQLLN